MNKLIGVLLEDAAKEYSEDAKRYRDEAEAIVHVDIATTEKAGIVKPDGSTITVEPDGTIHGIAQPVDALTAEGETLELVTRKGGVGVNRVLGKTHKSKNLLKPTLATTTLNGVTCTNNGDGTYTLNGTASALAIFYITNIYLSANNKTRADNANCIIFPCYVAEYMRIKQRSASEAYGYVHK